MKSNKNKLLKSLDLFGDEIRFNLKGEPLFKTKIGGIGSLILIGILITFLIFGAINVFAKKTYYVFQFHLSAAQISNKKIIDVNPPSAKLDSSEFMFALKVDFPTIKEFIGKTLFEATYQQKVKVKTENGTNIKIDGPQISLVTCTEAHFQSVDQYNADDFGFSQYLCLPLEYQVNLTGQYNSPLFEYGKLELQLCTNKPNCFTRQEFQQFLDNKTVNNILTVSTLIINTIVDPGVISDNILYSLYSDIYFPIKFTETKINQDFFLDQTKLITDDTLFSFQEENFNTYGYELYFEKVRGIEVFETDITKLATLNFRISSSQTLYQKRYYSLDEFISYLGGLFQIFVSLFGIILCKYNKQKYPQQFLRMNLYLKLAHHLYKYNPPDENKSYQSWIYKIWQHVIKVQKMTEKFKDSASKLMSLAKAGSLRKTFFINGTSSNKRQQSSPVQNVVSRDLFLADVFENIIEKQKKLSLSISFFISMIPGLNRLIKDPIVQITKDSIEKVAIDLDIICIMESIQELQKLKKILLTREQKMLFNFIPKPIIRTQKEGEQVNLDYGEDFRHFLKQMEQRRQKNLKNSANAFLTRRTEYNTSEKLKKLFNSYKLVASKQSNRSKNERIMKQLGPELNEVFQLAIQLDNYSERDQIKEEYDVKTTPKNDKDSNLSNLHNFEPVQVAVENNTANKSQFLVSENVQSSEKQQEVIQ